VIAPCTLYVVVKSVCPYLSWFVRCRRFKTRASHCSVMTAGVCVVTAPVCARRASAARTWSARATLLLRSRPRRIVPGRDASASVLRRVVPSCTGPPSWCHLWRCGRPQPLPRARAACCRCRLPLSCPLWRCGRLSFYTCALVVSTPSQRRAGPSSPCFLCRHGRPAAPSIRWSEPPPSHATAPTAPPPRFLVA
jgi:hypothetical protein